MQYEKQTEAETKRKVFIIPPELVRDGWFGRTMHQRMMATEFQTLYMGSEQSSISVDRDGWLLDIKGICRISFPEDNICVATHSDGGGADFDRLLAHLAEVFNG